MGTKKPTETTMEVIGKFRALAQNICNGCDLITSEENKLSTDEVLAAGALTIEDFALCSIDDKEVGVVTFVEMPKKYYWGGQAITAVIKAFCDVAGSEIEARAQYAEEKEKVQVMFESTKTKSNLTFTKVTVL